MEVSDEDGKWKKEDSKYNFSSHNSVGKYTSSSTVDFRNYL